MAGNNTTSKGCFDGVISPIAPHSAARTHGVRRVDYSVKFNTILLYLLY